MQYYGELRAIGAAVVVWFHEHARRSSSRPGTMPIHKYFNNQRDKHYIFHQNVGYHD
jgi:hypothetical protein